MTLASNAEIDEEAESREVEFSDGVELIIDHRGSKIYVAQRVWHMRIDGSEEPEEWHVASGRIVSAAELFNRTL